MFIAAYRPATLFGPDARIGRKQFIVSFGYQLFVAAVAIQFHIWASATSGFASTCLTALSGAAGLASFLLTTMAVKARLADAGMSPKWLALPVAFLILDLIRVASGFQPQDTPTAGMASFAGFVFVVKAAMAALLLLLAIVPSRVSANDNRPGALS